eukprot:6184851-Pleurochrysis_carterae.AAC.1
MFKHLVLRHADAWCRMKLTDFFKGLKRPIDLRKKGEGRLRADKWWRASTWDSMVEGCQTLPGGLAAWLPSVCLIIIACHMQARQSAAAGSGKLTSELALHTDEDGSNGSCGGGGSSTAQSAGYQMERDLDREDYYDEDEEKADGGHDNFEKELSGDIGISLAGAILTMLRGFD